MAPSISIATSLIPGRDVELQATAIKSWRACGLEVVSVNSAAEIPVLRTQFTDIGFNPAPRTAERIAGKPVPHIRDLLLSARSSGDANGVIGFINSDILLRPVEGLAQTLYEHARDALVLLPRVDVADATALASFRPSGNEAFSVGYDGVFMPARMLDDIPDNIFSIGMPFWDYWLPMIAILKNRPLKSVASPVALHVSHPSRWDGSIYLYFHALASDLLKIAGEMKAATPSPAFHLAIDALGHVYHDMFERGTKATQDAQAVAALAAFYDRLQEVIVHHIKAHAQPIIIPNAGPTA
ncbi:MAG: hypothetical protein SFV19_19980 [Rhodospirillaceae bacterium]|nr:hypothetical protein [Rhodospirillaceae bacterium]